VNEPGNCGLVNKSSEKTAFDQISTLALMGEGGAGGARAPQLSRSRYSDRAVTLIQQSVKDGYTDTAIHCSVVKIILCFGLKCPQIQSPGTIFKNFLGGTCPQIALDEESPLK